MQTIEKNAQLTASEKQQARQEVVDTLLDEINAVRQIAEEYKNDPTAFAAVAMIEDEIDRAHEALRSEALADIVVAYHRLKKLR